MKRSAVAIVAAGALMAAGAPVALSADPAPALAGICQAEGGTFSSSEGWWQCDQPDVAHATLNSRPPVPLQLCRSLLGRQSFGGWSIQRNEPAYWVCYAKVG